jgi:PAS domain S-box-containing protein
MLSSLAAALIIGSPDAVLLADEEGRYVDANPAALALLGYAREDLLRLSVRDIVAPGPIWAAEEYARYLREGTWQGDVELRTQHGRVVPAEAHAIVIPGPEGTLYASFLRDVTDRRRMEAELRAAEARYRSLVEHLPAVVALNAPDATQSTLYISPSCEAIFGYTPDDYLADPTLWIRMMHPEDRERVLADLARMNATGEAVQDAYRMLSRDGRVVWILEDSTLIRDDDGHPLYWQTVQLDVTARKQTEYELRQSEERFRTAFVSAAVGMALIDLDHRFLQVNAALCALLGFTEAELLARTFHDITHPDDLAADLAQVQRLAAGEIRVYEMEKRYIHENGEVVWGHLSCALVRDQRGEPLHFIGQVEDITARKAAEAALKEAETKYRTLVEQLPAVVYIVANDAPYTPLFYNSYIEVLTGETPEEALARTGYWLEDVHPEDRERIAAAEARAAKTGEVFQVEYRRRRQDGSYCWVRNEAVPLYDEAGQIITWQGVMLNISDRKQAEEDLQAALEEARAANRAKGLFLDIMTHELRTPLQAVLGYAESLLIHSQATLTLEQQEDIGYIHQSGGRMLTLINQLLDLSRMEVGRLVLAEEVVDLGQVSEAVRQDVAPQAAAKGLALQIALGPSLPSVIGDEERVRQILLNLAGNAVKFTDAGGVTISAAETTGGEVEVLVRDTGVGISAADLPHIFEEFRQGDSRLSRRHGGAGLGLAIAARLAQQMAGRIEVSSEPGVGSTFRLYLPAGQP